MTRPIRILLVEDNPGDVDLIRDTFDQSHYLLDVTVISDGAKAVEYILQRRAHHDEEDTWPPDLMLLDLNLPKVSGHEVLRTTRAAKELRGLPIIVVTSSEAPRDITTSYALGANCYVTKPGDLKAFQTLVKAVGDFWFSVVKLP
jgi:two-component system, chemotaxis family, response regulator Rcp1